jgi:hypothetical protein
MASPSAQGILNWFHPGEVLIVARVASDAAAENHLHGAARNLLAPAAGRHFALQPESMRSFVFSAPRDVKEDRSVAFIFQKLASGQSVKDAVEALHEQVPNLHTNELEVLGVMPHWHTRAHEGISGGSPGSLPAPIPPDKVRKGARHWRYQVRAESLRANGSAHPIPVTVLDTRVDLREARTRAVQLRDSAGNDQLLGTIDALLDHDQASGPLLQRELAEVAKHHPSVDPEVSAYRMPDHALFVAGLIHDLAPSAPLTLMPVLDEGGVGDLSLLLAALRELLERKPEGAPWIVNMSLGFRPHPGHLPAAWYGLTLDDPTYTPAPEMFDPRHDRRWVASHGHEVARTTDLLQAGLSLLGRYLSLNNCLVVAAAGNDSEAGDIRLEPRLPARFETVLGVAATDADPRKAASYSNLGDEQRRGDHVATFGGERDARKRPIDGVVGVYSGDFPSEGDENATGWAYWSGTSFATAIVSGIAANVWAHKPRAHASEILADMHEAALTTEGGGYVPELRAASIPIRGDWA